ncbi:unnamed protein product [Candida verbasci]|uniref:PCI domain-containing protein n=1 Tax=Candida verbasci TaxID=1227364 RepID=A0A9W4TUQ9_9ASCO|nr:unnamed protein product [Candida verbasci]
MASVIVVDNDLIGSIKEYSSVIDNINNSNEFSSSLNLPQSDSELNKQELFEKINNESNDEKFKKLTDKEFEPTFYLLIHILSELSTRDQVLNDFNSTIYKKLIKVTPSQPQSLKDRKSIKSTTILSIYSTIFNLLPTDSNTRIYILKEILKVIKASKIEFNLIEKNIGNNLIPWLKEANCNEEEIKELFWNFVQLDSNYSKKSLNLIKNFTHLYKITSDLELNNLITFALNSKTVDVSFLINNNVAECLKSNSSNDLAKIFNKYIHGEVISESDFKESINLPKQFIIKKSKILALAKDFSNESNERLSFDYKEIPNVESSFELEELLVDAIKSGVIEGKLNQVDEKFYLTRVNRFIVAGEDNEKNWNDIKSTLQQWKESLNNINEVVKAARENIVNNSSA